MNLDFPLSFIVNGKTLKVKLTDTKLGEGAFGCVQLGYDMNDKKTYYAVKQMERKQLDLWGSELTYKENPRRLQCLQREIEC